MNALGVTSCSNCHLLVRFEAGIGETLSWVKCPCCKAKEAVYANETAEPHTSVGAEMAGE